VHVPGLALAAAQLTRSHAQLLLAIAVKSLCAGPTIAVSPQNAIHLPTSPIRDQHLRQLLVAAVLPDHNDPYRVCDLRDAHSRGVVPLAIIAPPQFPLALLEDTCGELIDTDALPSYLQFAVSLEVPHVSPRLSLGVLVRVDVIEVLGIGKIAVKREVARDVSLADPVDQLAEQHTMILEGFASRFALLALLEAAELQRVVLAAFGDVIGEQIIVGDLVTLFGVIPEPTDVLDQLAVMVNQHVIDGDHATLRVAGRRVLLQQRQPLGIQFVNIPASAGQKAIETRLVGGLHELGIDTAHALTLGNDQPSEVLGQVASLRLIGQQVGHTLDSLLHNMRKRNDRRHSKISSGMNEPSPNRDSNPQISSPTQHRPNQPLLATQHLALAS